MSKKKRRKKPCRYHPEQWDYQQCAEQNWERPCIVCGQKPTVCCVELCGPCTWGEADTAMGNW